MIKKLYLLLVILFALSFVACDESEEMSKYANWKERNEAFMDSLARVYKPGGDLFRIEDERNKGAYIYYEKLDTAKTKKDPPPFYTSKVTMFYRGMYINGDVFDENFSGDVPSDFDTPSTFGVNQVITGWTEILQIMHPDDRFKVYIPYKSGYGTSTSSSGIMAYSTLIFDMKMVNIELYPK
ncbi:MAG: FKBP-type peptidyl-prolyl cis-trans isomerase [Mediterranea sp.]|jgi:FKBP-type peptidyl-prolyl cis-trans isomerase FklB|nr:FKBP-type peptidyl-prolyl cis-trans isomerase [Mediterranea sp.]